MRIVRVHGRQVTGSRDFGILPPSPLPAAHMQIRLYNLAPCKYALQNIERHRLKISRIEDLNDPFELLPANLSDLTDRKLFREFKTSFDRDHGVHCFSKSWHNPVLWSHYAAKHSGICLGFDVDARCTFPVTYVKNLKLFDFSAIDGRKKGRPDFAEKEVRRLITTKFSHWQYEDEMRVFVALDHSTVQNGLYFSDFGPQLKLREVIVGARCNIPVREICEIVKRSATDVTVRKARLAFNSFSITEDLRFPKRIERYMQSTCTLRDPSAQK